MEHRIIHEEITRGIFSKTTFRTVHITVTLSHAEEYTCDKNNLFDDVISDVVPFDADLETFKPSDYFTRLRHLTSGANALLFESVTDAKRYERSVIDGLKAISLIIKDCQDTPDTDTYGHG